MESAPRTRPALASADRCVCGHTRFDHQHYRKGTDCGLCGCTAFRSTASAPARALAGLQSLVRRVIGR